MIMSIELKYDKSAKDAIDQIYERHYIDKMKDYQEVLLVGIGINYDKKAEHYECIIEMYGSTAMNRKVRNSNVKKRSVIYHNGLCTSFFV